MTITWRLVTGSQDKLRYGLDWLRWITSQQRGCPLPLPGKQLLIQPDFWFSHILFLLSICWALLICHGYFIAHLPESQLGIASGDELSAVEVLCCHLLYTQSFGQVAWNHQPWVFLPVRWGCIHKVSWILHRITYLSHLMCSRYSIGGVNTITGLCWPGKEMWKLFPNS